MPQRRPPKRAKATAAAPNKKATHNAAALPHIMSLLLHNSSITWHQQAVCRLLCTSRAMRAAVAQQLHGKLAVSFQGKVPARGVLQQCSSFSNWLKKHAKLMHTLHVDMPREDETINGRLDRRRHSWDASFDSGSDSDDSEIELSIVDTTEDALLAKALYDAATYKPPPPSATATAAAAAAPEACDRFYDMNDGEREDANTWAFCHRRAALFGGSNKSSRANRLPLRGFSSTGPCPALLRVLPAGLTSLEVVFAADDIKYCRAHRGSDNDSFSPLEVRRAMSGLNNLQHLTLRVGVKVGTLSSYHDCLDVIMLGVDIPPLFPTLYETEVSKEKAVDFSGLIELKIEPLLYPRTLLQLPRQLTKLEVGLFGEPHGRAQQPASSSGQAELGAAPSAAIAPAADARAEAVATAAAAAGDFGAYDTDSYERLERDRAAQDAEAAAQLNAWLAAGQAAATGNRESPMNLSHLTALKQLDLKDVLAHGDLSDFLWDADVLPPNLVSLRLPYGGSAQPLLALTQLTQLTQLNIVNCTMSGEQLLALNGLVSLQQLQLSFGTTACCLAAAAECSKLPQLQRLRLAVNSDDLQHDAEPANHAVIQAAVPQLSNVSRLELSGVGASCSQMRDMFGGGQLPQLRELQLQHFHACDEKQQEHDGVLEIGHLQVLTQLTRLELSGIKRMSSRLLLQVPGALPGLKAFLVSG